LSLILPTTETVFHARHLPSHGENRGSSPLGSASSFKRLAIQGF
jgi:hypothetical protein